MASIGRCVTGQPASWRSRAGPSTTRLLQPAASGRTAVWRGRAAVRVAAQPEEEGVRVRIVVPRQCSMGEHIKLVGDHSQLGSWEVQGAPSMRWVNDAEWVYEIVSPAGAQIAFKCVLANDNGEVSWEEGENHVLQVPPEANEPPEGMVRRVRMRCDWGHGSQEAHDAVQVSDEESHAPEFVAMRTHVTEELMMALEGELGGAVMYNAAPDLNADGADVIQRRGSLGILGAHYCRLSSDEDLERASLDAAEFL